MAETSPTRRRLHPLLLSGLAVMALALGWWLVYYGQYQGLSLLDAKWACLNGDTAECSSFQDQIGPTSIPVYSPWAWYIGILMALVGLYLTRRQKV